MRFGVVFPTTEIGVDPIAVRDLAQGVESLGFDHLITYDHVLGAAHHGRERDLVGPYDERHEFHEPFVLFGYLGAVTQTLELVVGVLVAPQRQTGLIAKQAAEVQLLSGGRLRLGVGTGWNWVEFEALGADFERRGQVLDEQAEVLRDLWSSPIVDRASEFHKIDRAGLAPLPHPRIPLWFGGYRSAAIRRSAMRGDGHLFGHLAPKILDSARDLRERVVAHGRSVDDFGLEAITDFTAAPERWATTAQSWQDAGGTHLSIRTMPTVGVPDSGCETVDDHLRAFEAWRDALQHAGVWPKR
jgi:probable F420-dependent oxidoreductase